MIKRKLFDIVLQELDKPEIVLITGARQTGKTTLLKQIIRHLKKQNRPTVYVDLDFEQDEQLISSQTDFINYLKLQFGNRRGYVFIDEIQRKQDAGRFLKGIYDRQPGFKFIVSGSGSIHLKEKIAESLAGRRKTYRMESVSFEEFAMYKTGYKYNDFDLWLKTVPYEPFTLLKEYLSFGGYPRVVTLATVKEKYDYLQELVDAYVKKDIVEFIGIREPHTFVNFLRLLAANEGKIISYSGLAKDLKIHHATVKKYLWYAQQTYIVDVLTGFYRNKTTELRRPLIVYFEDSGLANLLRGKFRLYTQPQDLGFLFQNFVFRILRQYCQENMFNLHYWRTSDGAEIDFVVDKFDEQIPVEVKFRNLTKPVATKAVYSFIETYKPPVAYIINLSLNAQKQVGTTTLKFVTWKEFIGEMRKGAVLKL